MQLEDMSTADLIALVKRQEQELAAQPVQQPAPVADMALPGCLADRLYEAISIARDRAQHAGSPPRMRKWDATRADLRAALAAPVAAPVDVPAANVAQVGELSEAQTQNLDLVISRLETISANNTETPRELADEALVCAHAILAAAKKGPPK